MQGDGYAGLGANQKPDRWITKSDKPIHPTHVALAASRKEVDGFFNAAIAAGGKDDGAPGPRERYHPHYNGAFVLDPDGNSVETC